MRLISALALMLLPAAALAQTALFPVKMLDTAHEARDQRADYTRRMALITDHLATALPADILTPDQVAASCPTETPGCLNRLAANSGAERAIYISVVKTSTLIMQLYAVKTETAGGTVTASHDLNFRGDTDESWTRAADFLIPRLRD